MGHSGMVTPVTPDASIRAGLISYAGRLHAAIGQRHHVASPLAAWLLLALCAPAAGGADRAMLAEVLGCDPEAARQAAADLLSRPHPQVAAAAAVWQARHVPAGPRFEQWRAALPAAVQTGDLPAPAELDSWARQHSFGLIERFPVQVDPRVYLVLATALATRVSWQVPFGLAPARELGAASPWASRLRQVLRTPEHGHVQFIAAQDPGDLAVHIAAADGLIVCSVAAAPDVPAAGVLAAAYRIGCAHADGADIRRRPLSELPLGDGPLWAIREELSARDSQDACTAVLPAWSARSHHDLGSDPALGFAAAARALAGANPAEARQAAMARYHRTGFEAAAVTATAVRMSVVRGRGPRRVAELRFGHPYAVVAVATSQPERPARQHGRSPWHGLPVFSAWVAEPEDAGPEDARPGDAGAEGSG